MILFEIYLFFFFYQIITDNKGDQKSVSKLIFHFFGASPKESNINKLYLMDSSPSKIKRHHICIVGDFIMPDNIKIN